MEDGKNHDRQLPFVFHDWGCICDLLPSSSIIEYYAFPIAALGCMQYGNIGHHSYGKVKVHCDCLFDKFDCGYWSYS